MKYFLFCLGITLAFLLQYNSKEIVFHKALDEQGSKKVYLKQVFEYSYQYNDEDSSRIQFIQTKKANYKVYSNEMYSLKYKKYSFYGFSGQSIRLEPDPYDQQTILGMAKMSSNGINFHFD